jgi:hypothetical protein
MFLGLRSSLGSLEGGGGKSGNESSFSTESSEKRERERKKRRVKFDLALDPRRKKTFDERGLSRSPRGTTREKKFSFDDNYF